jgi:glycosyltransferase involved in cell wall biosynthesis
MKVSEETIIHVQRPDHLLPFKFVKRKNPIVCTIHGNNLKSILKRKGRGYSGMYGLLEKVSIGRADKVLFVDSRTQESYLKKYPFLRGISSVIPVGINLEEHKLGDREELRRRFGFGKSEKVVLYVGRLEREKGPDFLLEVFAYLSTSIADTKLVLVGEGTLMPELRDFVGSLELPNVVFKGVLSRKEAFEIMKASDVLAIPSLFEAGPIVALESLASGTPVVSTDVGRVGEFLDGPMLGKIAERKTTKFSEALEEVLGWNRDEHSEGRVEKASHFDFRKTLSQTIVAYKSLIEEHGPESEV